MSYPGENKGLEVVVKDPRPILWALSAIDLAQHCKADPTEAIERLRQAIHQALGNVTIDNILQRPDGTGFGW